MGKQGYAFRGTVEENEVRVFCDEEKVPYEDFVKARLTTEILYKYPHLFDAGDM